MYVPVMKNRTVEISVLQHLSLIHVFDDNIFPLIELIQERTRSNNKNTFLQDLCKILEEAPSMHVMVDFYKSTKLRSTTDAIREYVTMAIRTPDFGIKELSVLVPYSSRVVPVISYLSESISLERIKNEAIEIRKMFPRLAFRVKVQEFDLVFSCIDELISSDDYLLLDLSLIHI